MCFFHTEVVSMFSAPSKVLVHECLLGAFIDAFTMPKLGYEVHPLPSVRIELLNRSLHLGKSYPARRSDCFSGLSAPWNSTCTSDSSSSATVRYFPQGHISSR